MRSTNKRRRNELEESPLDATEALRRNLLHKIFESVTTEDMGEIVRSEVAKAKDGDGKSAKNLMDMVIASSASATAPSVNVQQSMFFSEGRKVDAIIESRKLIVALIHFSEEPKTTEEIAQRLFLSGESTMEALSCDWFSRDGGRWHLTNAGRTSVLDVPSRILATTAESEGVSD